MSSAEAVKYREWDVDPELLGNPYDMQVEVKQSSSDETPVPVRPLSAEVARAVNEPVLPEVHPGTLAVNESFRVR